MAKGRIAALTPLAAGDLQYYLIRGSVDPHQSDPQTASRSVQPFLHSISVWTTDRQTHRSRYVWHL